MFLKETDDKLIEKALDGSQRAWVKLVKRHEQRIYNYCCRMCGSRSEAMDLMQDVFLAIFRNLPNFRGQSEFSTWTFRIAANKTTDWLRRRHRVPTDSAEELECEHLPAHIGPEQQYHQFRSNQQITESLAVLPDNQRLVVELKFFQHFTFEEIAEQLGVSTNTVKTRLYTALRKLKGHMEVQHVV